MKVDLIIHAMHMYTMEGAGVGYRECHSIVVDRGKILVVLPRREVESTYAAERVIDMPHMAALPGFVDCHMHTRHAVYRGVAQDLANWMWDGMAPYEANSTSEAKAAGSRVAIAEAIMNGTTTLGDDGPDMEGAIQNMIHMGVRGNISPRIREVDFSAYGPGELYRFHETLGDQSLNECLRLFRTFHNYDGGRIRILFGPQGADFISSDRMRQVCRMAKEHGTMVHMHTTQGKREDEQILKRYGLRPVPYLDGLGVLSNNMICVHLTSATEEEVALVAQRGASMIFCPSSIAAINGIIPPAKLFMEAGGVVGLGSDQSPGNNNHNMFNEMKLTALLNKCQHHTPLLYPAWKVLRMATIEGATAIGLGDVAGSLEAGKAADIILVNLRHPTLSPVITHPVRNMVPNLVYAARGNEVDTVIVNGCILMEGRKPLSFDLDEILFQAQIQADELSKRASPRVIEENGAMMEYMKNGQL